MLWDTFRSTKVTHFLSGDNGRKRRVTKYSLALNVQTMNDKNDHDKTKRHDKGH